MIFAPHGDKPISILLYQYPRVRMKTKKTFVMYPSWRSYFELLDDAEQCRELLYAIFDTAEGKAKISSIFKSKLGLKRNSKGKPVEEEEE